MTRTKTHLAAGAFAALILCLAVPSRAEDVPIVSMKRLAIAAQVGAQWQRGTSADADWQRQPIVKLVPAYRLYGPTSGLAKGSIALVCPAELSLTSEHQARFGVFLSVILWDGSDAVTP